MDERTNAFLAAFSGVGNFIVTQRFVESFSVALFLFVCGKAVDIFLKPYLEEKYLRRKRKTDEPIYTKATPDEKN